MRKRTGSSTQENSACDKSMMTARLHSSMWANITMQPFIMLFSIVGSVVVARVLGPELLAVIAAISATGATINTFMDFGLTRSLPKIMPDISVRFGKDTALQVQYKIAFAKIIFVVFGLVGMILLKVYGLWTDMEGLTYMWFYPLVATKVLLGSLLVIQQQVAAAAFHNRIRAQLNLLMSICDPLISIILVLIWRNPYLVVAGSLVPSFLHLLLLKKYASYDFDESVNYHKEISWKALPKEYRAYISVTYFVFLFNRLVYGLPLTLWILTIIGVTPVTIGNAALAVSLVQRAWDIANTPLTNIRAPLLARLHIKNNDSDFFQAQRLMVAIVILTSGTMTIIISALGRPLLGLIYGGQYQDGIAWGVTAATIALIGNFFSLGNSTLHQTNRFLPVIVGMLLSAIFIFISYFWALQLVPPTYEPLIVILGYVGGRCLFWLITDIWTDFRIFFWKGSFIKIRALLAISLSLTFVIILNNTGYYLISAPAGLLIFFGVFRLLGGVGDNTRVLLRRVLGPKFRIVPYIF